MAGIPVFSKFEVYPRIAGGSVLAWELSEQFKLEAPLDFTILVSRSSTGDFIELATVSDTYIYEDTEQWLYGKSPRLHYQIQFRYQGTTFSSTKKQVLGNLGTRDIAIMREMIRREEVRQRLTGQCGYLYKRRVWGQRCTVCVDWNTLQSTDAHCATCYGTGWVGGYFDPVGYRIVDSVPPSPRRKTTNMSTGMQNNKVKQVRGLNCPWLDTNDIWVDFDSDRRYVVQTIRNLDYRGVTFVFDPIELRLLPATDVAYQLPRPEDESSSSSSSSSSGEAE